jgi:acyl carrier protein
MASEKIILSQVARVIRDYNRATGKSIRHTNLSMSDHFCDDLGGDSIELIEMVLAIEDAFRISINEDDFIDADPWVIGNFVRYIEKRMREAQVGAAAV